MKAKIVGLRKSAERLAKEKNEAIDDITNLGQAAELKFKLLSLETIIDDQIDVYKEIIRAVNRLKRIQRSNAFDEWNKVSPIAEDMIKWQRDVGIFLGLLLKSLKRQRRALKKKLGAYVWLMGFLFRFESESSKQERFRSAFNDFYINYEAELEFDRRYRQKMGEMLAQMRAKLSLMDRTAIVLSDPELRAIVEKAAAAGDKEISSLRAEIDRVLEHKMGKRMFTALFYRNAKWTLKKVTPFTIFSPVPGTNVAVITCVMLFTLGQAAKSVYVDRKAAKATRLAA
ncbi:hypothetical protein KY359_00645 [Candidatus Woesearchaeota archaeon]|nr:hypothetical protein [Candidatus Woesearchaeota archaeon]